MGVVDGKVCIITGGAGSIGLASASLLLKEGGRVMLVGRNEENLIRAAGAIKPITGYPEEIFDAVMAMNIRGSFLACKYGLPQMNGFLSILFLRWTV